jgi:hypothetical protein
MIMPVANLEQVLAVARAEEARSQELERKLSRMLAELHPSIHLPEASRLRTLLAFVDEYVAHVPRLVQALDRAARDARQELLIAPLLGRIRASYCLRAEEGMASLLDRAYYVQRLIEEINDRFLLVAGAPLLTLDMTTANLIIHALIGEPYANQLDTEAASTAAHIMNLHVGSSPERFYTANQDQRLKMWTAAWRHWSEEFGLDGIALRFEGEPPPRPTSDGSHH